MIENPFKHSINLMKFALVQSFGRLVRKESDWGTVTVLDPRLWYRGTDWGIDDCIPVKREHWYCDDPGEAEWMQRAMSIIPKGGKSDRTGNIFEE